MVRTEESFWSTLLTMLNPNLCRSTKASCRKRENHFGAATAHTAARRRCNQRKDSAYRPVRRIPTVCLAFILTGFYSDFDVAQKKLREELVAAGLIQPVNCI